MAENALAASEAESSLLEWIDEVADRFESAWRDGVAPDLAEFLNHCAGAGKLALLRELVQIDRAYRSRLGQSRTWTDYCRAFPELAESGSSDEMVTDHPTMTPPRSEVSATSATGSSGPQIPGYALEGLLGRGGMGVVYRAKQLSLNRAVALKVVRAGVDAQPRELARFQAEAETAARLRHPNIVQIYEVGKHNGQPYLAMELVEGPSLAQLLDGRPQPPMIAARFVEVLARAIHSAHQEGVVHRDLKPANILLSAECRVLSAETRKSVQELSTQDSALSTFVPKITDFGLAKRLDVATGETQSGEILGTPKYMAPEQATGEVRAVGPATDVYALAAILYELLTGRAPFEGGTVVEILDRVRAEEPAPLSQVLRRSNLRCPRDLETICMKALAKTPAQRYASAADLADDLERFLQGRPILARPVSAAERFWRWCRRNPFLALFLAALALLLLTVTVAALVTAGIARQAADDATARALEERRQVLLRRLELMRSTTRSNGWSDEAWNLATEIAAIHKDGRIRDEAAATLAGLDARIVKKFDNIPAGSVAIDPAGERVLLGGLSDHTAKPKEPAKLWDRRTGAMTASQQIGSGPVLFRPDGTPIQVLRRERGVLLLWDLVKQQPIREFTLPQNGLPHREIHWTDLAISRDGAWIAAATDSSGSAPPAEVPGSARIAVWQTSTGQLQFQAPVAATALAFAPAGDVLAVGDSDGQITLWSIPSKPNEHGAALGKFRNTRIAVESLAFRPDGQRWAAGHADGMVTVWDRGLGTPVMSCQGSLYNAYTVAFGSDGTILATGGRGPVCLWDAATGKHLLNIEAGDFATGLAFDATGRHLAVTCQRTGAILWELEYNRGIHTLHGIGSPVSLVRFAADGKRFAAMGNNWQLGVWDVATGRLVRFLDAPKGFSPDNADFAFDGDCRQLAFSTWKEARVWNLDTGAWRSWPLPPGLADVLLFSQADQLSLFRVETSDSQHPPLSNSPSDRYPRVCRLRNLLAADPLHPILEVSNLSRHVFSAGGSAAGGWVVAEGVRQEAAGMRHWLMAFDCRSGRELWSSPLIPDARTSISLNYDPSGNWLFTAGEPPMGCYAVNPRTGQKIPNSQLPNLPTAIGPAADLVVWWSDGTAMLAGKQQSRGYSIHRRGDDLPFLVLGIDSRPAFHQARFSHDGTYLAWGTMDGTVQLCHLPTVRERLSRIGLEW